MVQKLVNFTDRRRPPGYNPHRYSIALTADEADELKKICCPEVYEREQKAKLKLVQKPPPPPPTPVYKYTYFSSSSTSGHQKKYPPYSISDLSTLGHLDHYKSHHPAYLEFGSLKNSVSHKMKQKLKPSKLHKSKDDLEQLMKKKKKKQKSYMKKHSKSVPISPAAADSDSSASSNYSSVSAGSDGSDPESFGSPKLKIE